MRKLDLIFIFLAVLLSADYLTSVVGINWLEEQNQLVVQTNSFIGNWLVTFTLLYLLKLAALVGIYELERFFRWKYAEFEAARRVARAIAATFLLVLYFVIVVNNFVLIASALSCFDSNSVYFSYTAQPYEQTTQSTSTTQFEFKQITFKYADKVEKILFKIPYSSLTSCWLYQSTCYWYSDGILSGTIKKGSTTVGYAHAYYYPENGELVFLLYIDSIDEGQVNYGDYITIVFSGTREAYISGNYVTLTFKSISIKAYTRSSGSNTLCNKYDIDLEYPGYYDVGLCGLGYTLLVQYSSSDTINYNYTYEGEISSSVIEITSTYEYDFKFYNSSDGLIGTKSGNDIYFYTDETIKYFQVYSGDWLVQTVNINCELEEVGDTGSVTIYFMDSSTGALLDNVNFSISGEDFSDSGVYDYKVIYTSDQLTQGNTYSYTASRDSYQPVSGSFTFTGGQVIKLYFVPIIPEEEIENPENNTALTFTVTDCNTGQPLQAQVDVNGYAKLTNENGFVWFTVQKNGTYSYTIRADGYLPISGDVFVGTEQVDIEKCLMSEAELGGTESGGSAGGVEGSGTTGGSTASGTTGGVPEFSFSTEPSQAESNVVNMLVQWGQYIIYFALMIVFLNIFGMIRLPTFGARRRRR